MKGKKSCPNEHICAARASRCTECNHQFYETEDDKNLVDWRKLQKGQMFRSVQGHGPYYDPPEGERQYLGHYIGKFTVLGIDANGILARNEYGFCYVYMGEEKPSKIMGILSPHKIKLIKQRKEAS
jgi:hypothetical protein